MLQNIQNVGNSGGSYKLRADLVGPDQASRPAATDLADGFVYVAADVSKASVVVDRQWSEWFSLAGPQGPAGPAGETGASGPAGPQGPAGTQGPAATMAIDRVVTLDPDAKATVENVGTSSAALLRFGIPRGADGGGATTSSTEALAATTVTESAVAWDGAGYSASGEAATHAANASPTADDLEGDEPLTAVTLVGLAGQEMTLTGTQWHGIRGWDRANGPAAGEQLCLLVVFQNPTGDTMQLRVAVDGGAADSIQLNTDGTVTTDGWADNDGLIDEPTTANDAYNQVVALDAAADIYLAQVKLVAAADLSGGTLDVYLNTSGSTGTFAVAPLYVGATAVDGDADPILPPGGTVEATLELSGSGPWVATVDTPGTVLVPPALPTDAGARVVREMTVEITGDGTLTLDPATAAWAYDAPAGDALGAGTHDVALLGREADSVWRVDWSTYR